MSWEFYFERVVDRHMVYLAGYPPELTFNIHKLGVRQLAILHNALKADPPTLYWAKATDDIVEELRKTAPIKTRKQRADKGKKRRVYKSGKRSQPQTDEEATASESGASDSNDEGRSAAVSKWKLRARRNMISQLTVDSSEDD